MIYYFTPYQHRNLGAAYNHYCSLVQNDNDWITIMDGDVMQMHMDWGEIWNKILNENDEAGIVTCMTNRAAKSNDIQLCKKMFNNKDIKEHRQYALILFEKFKYETQSIQSDFMSGFYFAFKKSTWKLVNGFTDGILHIDKDFFLKVNKLKPIKVALGFYVLHYYRMCEGHEYTNHLTD